MSKITQKIKKYHFVYRITNTYINKHYYGIRTSEITPKKDLGITYFSSSSDKEFIKDQKENPQNYKYKVLKVFSTREEAIEMEIMLHKKFDIGINEKFYNKAKQTSKGFDTSGIKLSEDHKKHISEGVKKTNYIPSEAHKKMLREKAKGSLPQPNIKCPHCGKVGGDRAMKRFHFDNCPLKTGIKRERLGKMNNEMKQKIKQTLLNKPKS